MCQSPHKSGIFCFAMHDLLSVGTCLKTHNLLPKEEEKKNNEKELLYIYLNNNIKCLKSALLSQQGPSALGMGSVLSAHSLFTEDTGAAWGDGSDGKPRIWRRKPGDSSRKGFIPFEMPDPVLCTYSQVSWEWRSFGQSLELSQFHQFGKQGKDKGLGIIYRQEAHGSCGAGQQGAQPHSSSVLPNL